MTTAAAGDPAISATNDDAAPGVRDRLTEAVRGLATRASRGDAEQALRLAGPVLFATGSIVILLGWYGAANTTRVFLQIPYLISGGLFGLALVFAGGFLYFSRWVTDLLDESRRQAADAQSAADRTLAALERIEDLLRDGAAPAPDGGGRTSVRPATTLVTTLKGAMAHRPDCRLVVGRDVRAVEPDASVRRCQICRPPL